MFDPNSKPAMVGFFDVETSPEYAVFINFAEEVGINGALSFFVSKVSYQIKDVAEFVGAVKDKTVFIIEAFQNFTMNRYKLNCKVSQVSLREFKHGFATKTIPKYIKSESEPIRKSDLMRVVTGNSFTKLVPPKKKYLLLAIVDQDCISCVMVA